MSVEKFTPEQHDILDHMESTDGILMVSAGAGCVDKDTEFLTPKGWKFISDYLPGDKVAQWFSDSSIEFITPIRYVKQKADTLNSIQSNTIDMVISDEHRVPYITDKLNFRVKHFYELKNIRKINIPRSYDYLLSETYINMSDDLLRVLVMQSADGSHIKYISKYKIRINVKKELKKDRVIKLLDKAGIVYSIVKSAEGYLSVCYYPPEEIAFKGLKCLWACNTRQLKIVGDEATKWDASVYKRKNVTTFRFTGNKQDAELIQHAWHILTGNYVTISKDKRTYKKCDLYDVKSSSRSVSTLTFRDKRNKGLTTIKDFKTLDGYEYCFTTPSSFWLARRNGKVFPTGNSGKSFMSEKVANRLQPKTALYTAFNKAIVKEGVYRFKGLNVVCKTLHALARSYVKPTQKIEDLSYTCITENISYARKANIINAINTFFVSASTDMYSYMEELFSDSKNSEQLTELSIKYIDKMLDKEINPTFNFLLKYFHLMLVEKSVTCKYDLVILDEINDVTAVALEIFKLIESPKKLGLGEPHQAIYQFLNLVDGFDDLKDEPLLNLTQSFRCSSNIANAINEFMNTAGIKNFNFTGIDSPTGNGKTAHISLTNSVIISKIHEYTSLGLGFTLLRTPSDIFACPLALMTASNGKEPYQKKYKYLKQEFDYYQDNDKSDKGFFSYLIEHVEDTEIQNAIRLLMNFKQRNINLFDLFNKAKNSKADPNRTLCTAHSSKGLEFETVYIGDDLNSSIRKIIANGGIKELMDEVAYRIYYVACSRAQLNLYNADFPR